MNIKNSKKALRKCGKYLGKKKVFWFTLVELIVVITILSILWTIAFVSLQWYNISSRDAVRASDIKNIKKTIDLYGLENGNYPEPTNSQIVTYLWEPLWYQWTFWDQTHRKISRLSNKPVDPLYKTEYSYSINNIKNEYLLSSIWENWDTVIYDLFDFEKVNASNPNNYIANVSWNYNWLILKVSSGWLDYLVSSPSIIASDLSGDLSLGKIVEDKKLVFDWYKNLPDNVSKISSTSWWFDFNPWNLEVFSWSISELSQDSEKLKLIKNLQNVYFWTTIKDKKIFKNVLNLDADNNPESASLFAENLIVSSFWEDIFTDNKKLTGELSKVKQRGFVNVDIDTRLSYKGSSYLDYPSRFKIYEQDNKTYTVILWNAADSIVIYDITDPSNPIYKDHYSSYIYLENARDMDIAKTPSGKIYAIAISSFDKNIVLFDITNPNNIRYINRYEDSTYLWYVSDVDFIETDTEKMYAASTSEDGRNKYEYLMTYKIENNSISLISRIYLDKPKDVRLYKQNGEYYAIVSVYDDNEIEIYKITDTGTTIAGRYTDTSICKNPNHLSNIFERLGKKYIITTANSRDRFCIYDITDPSNIEFIVDYFDHSIRYFDKFHVEQKDGGLYATVGYPRVNNNKVYIYDITDFDNIIEKVKKNVQNIMNNPRDVQFYHQWNEFYFMGLSNSNLDSFSIYDVLLEETQE